MKKELFSVLSIVHRILTDTNQKSLILHVENDFKIPFLFIRKRVWLDQNFVSLDDLKTHYLSN